MPILNAKFCLTQCTTATSRTWCFSLATHSRHPSFQVSWACSIGLHGVPAAAQRLGLFGSLCWPRGSRGNWGHPSWATDHSSPSRAWLDSISDLGFSSLG